MTKANINNKDLLLAASACSLIFMIIALSDFYVVSLFILNKQISSDTSIETYMATKALWGFIFLNAAITTLVSGIRGSQFFTALSVASPVVITAIFYIVFNILV